MATSRSTAAKAPQTAAKAAESAAKPADAPKPPALDFSALTVTDAEPVTTSRKSKVEGTPFLAWVRESHENGTAKAVTVPAANKAEVIYLIRSAAQRLNIGVRVSDSDAGNGNVRIAFQGKARRAYTKRQK